MRQAITTRYLGPTNHKGSRIKAWCQAGMITTAYLYELSVENNHLNAAMKLMQKIGWDNDLIGGWQKHDGVFIQVGKK